MIEAEIGVAIRMEAAKVEETTRAVLITEEITRVMGVEEVMQYVVTSEVREEVEEGELNSQRLLKIILEPRRNPSNFFPITLKLT